jgi:hypothetical protein
MTFRAFSTLPSLVAQISSVQPVFWNICSANTLFMLFFSTTEYFPVRTTAVLIKSETRVASDADALSAEKSSTAIVGWAGDALGVA